jgi:dephospho-CoA kinase
MKIIGFVGMPGSGKSVASEVARSMGLKVAVMGDVIRQEAARQGLEPSDENLGNVGNMLRSREGPEAVARRTLEAATDEKIVVIDGLRSKAEADFFRSNAEEFHLVEIVAPAKARMRWIVSRGRPDDPGARARERDLKIVASCKDGCEDTAEALEKRECRELGWGMYEAMREADMRLQNEGGLDEFRASVRRLLEELVHG